MFANKQPNKKLIIFVQLIVLTVVYILSYFVWSKHIADSLFYGGLVIVVSSLFSLARGFFKGVYSPFVELGIFYLSNFLKTFIIAIGTILIAIYIHPDLFGYIFGLILLQICVIFVLSFNKAMR